MRQYLTISLFLFLLSVMAVSSCTPVAPPHTTKDHYSTGIIGEEQTRVILGLPDTYNEVEEPAQTTTTTGADAGSSDTDCTPFHPDFPNC
ncbi:MAG TPA: hypothetical protein EYN06_01945 [Myxococcales bacterium]|nr:hypothetical protein [Myxococcales bacterium]HIN85213.1 hypothetical protein [Myxococcales bacterium]